MNIGKCSCPGEPLKSASVVVKAASIALMISMNSVLADNVGEVELAPGKSANCFSAPCTVKFHMPDGQGTYEIREGAADGTKIGDYPAGETVDLGGFYKSTSFYISGGDFKPAHLWVTGRF